MLVIYFSTSKVDVITASEWEQTQINGTLSKLERKANLLKTQVVLLKNNTLKINLLLEYVWI